MIIFHNPTELDLEAVRLMGASVKKPGSFGRFGTGLKYGIASVLRAGASLRMFIGPREYRFTSRAVEVRGETFEEVMLERLDDGNWLAESLGFTTQLGRDWEPWMVVRELACNARDEGGDFFLTKQDVPDCFSCENGSTLFALEWPEVEEGWDEVLAGLFVPAEVEPLAEVEGVRILPGKAQHIYHRGVRVMKLPKESAFTYDIAAPVELTEDRTAKYAFIVEENVRRALLSTEDPGIVAASVTHRDGWEGSLKWIDETWRKPAPGFTWLEEVGRLRERRSGLVDGAVKLYLMHRAVKEGKHYGGYYQEATPPALDTALGELEELHVRLKDEDIYVVAELPGGVMSLASEGRIYVTSGLLDSRPYTIARELLLRHLEVASGGDHDTLLEMVTETLLRNSDRLMHDRALLDEERVEEEKELEDAD